MNNRDSNSHQLEVAQAFEQPAWYLDGYRANIRVRCEAVAAFTRHRAFGRVLDIGCGDGSLSLPLLSETCAVTFLDLSAAMLKAVAAKVPEPLRAQAQFLQGDFGAAVLPPASFDLVLYVGVLAYVADVRAAAERIRRLLKPGGQLIIECTDAGHALARLNFGYRDLTALVRPAKCTTYRHRADDVTRDFEGAGFRPRESFRYAYTLPILSRFVNQARSYRLMRRVFGTTESVRRQRLGSEVLASYDAP